MREIKQHLKETIRALLLEHGDDVGVCPREAARAVAGSSKRGDWEPLMPQVREVVQTMVRAGEIVAKQHGGEVEIYKARGPVKLKHA